MVSLVVPGSSGRMLQKAVAIDVSEIVIDLEDAVIPERKPEALAAVLAALADDAPRFVAPKVTVRVNGVGTPWCHTELIALAAAPGQLDCVILPKAETAGDMAFVDRLLSGVEAAAPGVKRLAVQGLIETATGVANAHAIAAGATRLEGLILGYADLSVSLGRSTAARDDLDRWLAIQDALLVAARTAGIEAIDGPHLVIDDVEGLERASRRASDLGFDRKWAIHPSQIGPIKAAFRPSDEAIAHAQGVLGALRDAAAEGGGVVKHDGEMLDEPVRLAALRTLARAGVDHSEGVVGTESGKVPPSPAEVAR